MTLSRRPLLRRGSQAAVAPIFWPFLDSLRIHAEGGALPKRFVFIIKASGIDKPNLVPPGLPAYAEKRGDLVDTPLRELPAMLAPLARFKDRVTIVQGLSGQNLKGNHTAGYGTLSCHSSELVPVAPTIDALLGLKHSTGPYKMYGMATNGTLRGQVSVPDDAYVYPNLSAYRRGRGVAYQASPTKAFQELFGSAAMSPAELKQEAAIQRNLMEFLQGDARRIRGRLGAADKERFDAYVDTFESLRSREQKKAALKERIARHAPRYVSDKYQSMTHMDRMECQFELGAAALLAGLTNVITLRPDTLGSQYQKLGTANLGLHAIGHGAGVADGTDSVELRRRIDGYHMGLIARLAARLASVPEGDGTVLDNTLIVYTSCAGGKHHGGLSDWPFVLLGHCGGALRTGRYLQYPSYGTLGHRTLGNLYLSILRAGGIAGAERFGQPDPGLRDLDLRGPLDQLFG